MLDYLFVIYDSLILLGYVEWSWKFSYVTQKVFQFKLSRAQSGFSFVLTRISFKNNSLDKIIILGL